jgi:DNA-directed RNA polymerase beta subunit
VQQLTVDDMVTIIEHIATLNTTPRSKPDDIDHLGSRRVRFVGELVELAVRKGMARMKRNIQDKMSTIDTNTFFQSSSLTSDHFRLLFVNSLHRTSCHNLFLKKTSYRG